MSRIPLVLIALPALLVPSPARADTIITPAPIPDRVARATAIVVGKVTAFGDRTVAANPYAPAGPKVDHQIAHVEVQSVLLGDAKVKQVRVGFIPAGPRREAFLNLKLDEEACYFLTPHPEEPFFFLPMYYDRHLKKGNKDFDKDVALVKRCVKLLADPDASLKSREAEDRFLTAAMLVVRYRTRPPGDNVKTELVSAEQSKRILEALAEAKWDGRESDGEMAAPALFFRLGLTEKDGWKTPPNETKVPSAAKQWIKDHAGTYRIQRCVAEKPRR
jgi:hypothetical protein